MNVSGSTIQEQAPNFHQRKALALSSPCGPPVQSGSRRCGKGQTVDASDLVERLAQERISDASHFYWGRNGETETRKSPCFKKNRGFADLVSIAPRNDPCIIPARLD